jgi:hypothetical protein
MVYGFQNVIVKEGGLLVTSSKTLFELPYRRGSKFLRNSITIYRLTQRQIPEECDASI